MEERDRSSRHQQIDRYTVRDGHRQENAWCGGNPPVNAFDLNPAATCFQVHHLHAVHLIAQCGGSVFRKRPSKRTPAAHDFTDR
jgi:hypothetical protein